MKYNYERIIQGNFGYGWEDVSAYEVKSDFTYKTREERELVRHDLAEYRASGHGLYRVISRRELIV
jgi:hypothetical protein